MDKYLDELKVEYDKKIAETAVLLDGDEKSCRLMECNLGNLLTDAMVNYYINRPKKLYANCTECWTDSPIALLQGGGIRTSIEETNGHNVTLGDIVAVLPFENTVTSAIVTGSVLREVVEWSVNGFDPVYHPQGKFLQFSGMKVVYDLSRPDGQRVVDIQVKCAKCRVPEYRPLDINEKYRIIVLDFMLRGGDGYSMLNPDKNPGKVQEVKLGDDLDVDVAVRYFKGHTTPIMQGIEGRINFIDESSIPHSGSPISLSSSLFLIFVSLAAMFNL